MSRHNQIFKFQVFLETTLHFLEVSPDSSDPRITMKCHRNIAKPLK